MQPMIVPAGTERDELLTRLSYDLAALIDTAMAGLPPSTQEMVSNLLANGTGHLGVTVMMNPRPVFIGMVSCGPDKEPVELFRCSPSSGALRTKGTLAH